MSASRVQGQMKTTDKWVLTVAQANGWHTKIAYGSHQEQQAKQDCITMALQPGVVSSSVDLIQNWSGRRVTRILV